MDFTICFIRNRRKLTSFQRLRSTKRVTIDMEQVYDEYSQRDFRNLHVSSTILAAAQKRKDVYYLPDLTNHHLAVSDLMKMVKPLTELGFNLVLLLENGTLTGTKWRDDLDACQDEFVALVRL